MVWEGLEWNSLEGDGKGEGEWGALCVLVVVREGMKQVGRWWWRCSGVAGLCVGGGTGRDETDWEVMERGGLLCVWNGYKKEQIGR